MEKIFTFLSLLLLVSCSELHPYHCPPIHEHHKVMTHQDEKYLERKHHPFKKALPDSEKRESYSGKDDHLKNSHHHYLTSNHH